MGEKDKNIWIEDCEVEHHHKIFFNVIPKQEKVYLWSVDVDKNAKIISSKRND